jgi:hypothetical protein
MYKAILRTICGDNSSILRKVKYFLRTICGDNVCYSPQALEMILMMMILIDVDTDPGENLQRAAIPQRRWR